jgi:ribosomal-protein-alanine N-acetyltransferase
VTSHPPDADANADASGGAEHAGVEIRPATQADLLSVFRIEKSAFPQPWPFSAFERFLDEPAFLVAVRDPEIVGYVVADVTPNYGRDIGHVKDLAVRPDARGVGLGRRLLSQAIRRMASDGATLVKLEVREHNDAALSLYRDEGFELLRRVPGYYEDGETALVMVLDVDEWFDAQ